MTRRPADRRAHLSSHLFIYCAAERLPRDQLWGAFFVPLVYSAELERGPFVCMATLSRFYIKFSSHSLARSLAPVELVAVLISGRRARSRDKFKRPPPRLGPFLSKGAPSSRPRRALQSI